MPTTALATVVFVPRERFSATRQSLDSILAHTARPYKLVIVDGGSPRPVRRYLAGRAREVGAALVRRNEYLVPNQSRNLGLREADTKYVVFIDNDVVVTPGWLDALVRCAEETGADLITPLVCERWPLHSVVHCSGGHAHLADTPDKGRKIDTRMAGQGAKVENLRDRLVRGPTGLVEFHCCLARADLFDRLGPLDERVMNTREHIDLCLGVRQMGGSIYLEPGSVVTYLGVPPLSWSDVPFFLRRWSDAWAEASLARLQEKWGLGDSYTEVKLREVRNRRKHGLVRPVARWLGRLTFGRWVPAMEKRLTKLERWYNRRHTRPPAAARIPAPAPAALPAGV